MTHAEAQAKLDAYFAGSLPREEVRAFHGHLKACEQCRSLIRIRNAGTRSRRAADPGRFPPDVQQQMARNRAMLFRVLFVMLLAAWLFRMGR